MQNDNSKMYEAVKMINRLKPPQPLLVKGENGLTANPAEQSKIIAEYFKGIFFKNKEPMDHIPPTHMTKPFTVNEIRKAVTKMKSNKSPGCDELPVELIKYSSEPVYETKRNYAWSSETIAKTRESQRTARKLETDNPSVITPENPCHLHNEQS